jgi:hypothetical protein
VGEIHKDMQRLGVIDESVSPWSSSIVLIWKKDGTLRFCVDYRKLNSVTRKDHFTQPQIGDTLDTLAGTKWSSVLKRLHIQVMSRVPNDAIGRTFPEHLLVLRKVFHRFREAGLNLNPEKFQFLQMEACCLGHIVSPKRITTDPENLKSMWEWLTPKNKHEMRSFLDLCAYYRWFISGFASVTKLLTKLTEENHAFLWTPKLETAFLTLIDALCTAHILAYPQSRERFVIVGVLSQVQDRQ